MDCAEKSSTQGETAVKNSILVSFYFQSFEGMMYREGEPVDSLCVTAPYFTVSVVKFQRKREKEVQ
jgi:hypothetical protein